MSRLSQFPRIIKHTGHRGYLDTQARRGQTQRNMKIAIEGCCHGELDAIYSHITSLENANNYKVSLLIICGDFQAIRNKQDLQCMAVPDKYKKLGEFYKYYTGEKIAPILTIVIGGNHEASNYLWELYHGGWLAPNLYFLGHAGCVQVNGIRIAGASGIFQHYDFRKGHFERLPYDRSSMRSIYHIREYNVRRLSLLSSPDIFISHDWPQSIEHHGDLRGLLRHKPFFRSDIDKGALGSPPMMGLLRTLKPKWWFSAHLHTRFEATVTHEADAPAATNPQETAKVEVTNPDEIAIDDIDVDVSGEKDAVVGDVPPPAVPVPLNPDEIKLDEEEDDVVAPPPPPPQPSKPRETKFLALDKCLPRRRFLEVVDVSEPSTSTARSSPPSSPLNEDYRPVLTFDPEWLAITRAFNPFMSLNSLQLAYPDEAEARAAIQRELEWVKKNVYKIPEVGSNEVTLDTLSKTIESCQKFSITAPPPSTSTGPNNMQPPYYANPQTAAFCQMLGIENKIDNAR